MKEESGRPRLNRKVEYKENSRGKLKEAHFIVKLEKHNKMNVHRKKSRTRQLSKKETKVKMQAKKKMMQNVFSTKKFV